MKTISRRFLKAGVSILLVVMLLLSTTATGFAAVVDIAATSDHWWYGGDYRLIGSFNDWWWDTNYAACTESHGTYSADMYLYGGTSTDKFYFAMLNRNKDTRFNPSGKTDDHNLSANTKYGTNGPNDGKAFYLTRNNLGSSSNLYKVTFYIDADQNIPDIWWSKSSVAALSPSVTTNKSEYVQGDTVSLGANCSGTKIGTVSYSYEYKLSTSSTWTTVSGTSFIAPTTTGTYDVRVTATDNGINYTGGTNMNGTEARKTETATTQFTVKANTATVYTNGAAASTGGTVTVSPAYAAVGEKVTYTAASTPSYTFDGWYAAGTTNFASPITTEATYTATMTTAGTNVIAHFHKNIYYWYKDATEGNPSYDPSVSYDPATNVYTQSLENVTPAGGAQGDFWVATNSNNTVLPYGSCNGVGVELVKSDDKVTHFYLGALNTATHTTPITLTITPSAKGDPTSFVVVATATAKDPLTVTANVNDNSGISSISGASTYYADNDVTVTYNLNPGYFLENVTYTGDPKNFAFDKSNGKVTFKMGTTNVVLNATVSQYYTATKTVVTNKVESTTGGTVAITGANVGSDGFKAGSQITYTATPKNGYEFIGWYKDTTYDTELSSALTYKTTQTASGTSVVAVFAKTYYITGSAVGGWGVAGQAANWNKMTYDVKNDKYSYEDSSFTNSNNKFLITMSKSYDKVMSTSTESEGFNPALSQQGSGDKNYVLGKLDNSMYTTPITYYLSKAANGEYTVVRVEAAMASAYDFTVTGANTVESLKAKYPENYEVKFNVAIDSATQYVESVTATGNPAKLEFNESGAVTVKMPANAVTLTVVVKDKNQVRFTTISGLAIEFNGGSAYYKAGDPVSVKVKAKSTSYSVSDRFTVVARKTNAKLRTADGDPIIHTVTRDGDYYVIKFTMPEEGYDVEITPTVSAQFKVECYKTAGGTVAMTVGDEAFTSGGYVDSGKTVIMKATPSEGYTFLGYYSKPDYTHRITKASIYSFVPNADTKYYAVFAKDYYIVGDATGGWGKFVKMTYDPAKDYYYYDSDLLANGGEFKVFPDNSFTGNMFNSQASVDTSIHTGVAGLTVSKNGGTGSGANNGKVSNIQVGYGSPVRIFFKKINDTTYKFDAQAKEIRCKVYLSGGVDNMYGTSEHDLATSDFVKNAGDNYNVSDRKMIKIIDKNQNSQVVDYKEGKDSIESWCVATLPEAQAITVQTQINNFTETIDNKVWNYRDMYRVAAYVIYYADGTTDAVTGDGINYMGNGTYSATIDVEGTCYIVPIYYNTDAYNTAMNQVSMYIYVDADTTRDAVWGPFYSCYIYGKKEYNGAWPGQLMIPTKDGKTYFQRIDVVKGDVTGIVINNFMKNTVPAKAENFKSEFGISSINEVQTYDYKEPIYLFRSGYNTFTFDCKLNEDGYHGQFPGPDGLGNTNSGNKWNKIKNGQNIDTAEFTFQPLVDRNDRYLDLSGNVIANPSEDPEFYIVSAGDVRYTSNGSDNTKNYPYDDYEGKWSVDWYIYDKNGNYITTILSGAIFDRGIDTPTRLSGLEQALAAVDPKYNPAYLSGKSVAISYENNNVATGTGAAGTSTPRTDGQWSGNKKDDKMTVDVKVGLYEDGDFTVNTVDPVNKSNYGVAFVEDAQSAQVSFAKPLVNLTADTMDKEYVFIGWYTLKNGTYVKADEAADYQATISKDVTYYAMFQKINADDLVINHMKYVNHNDSEILSHNGTANMEVEIYELADGQTTGGTLVAKADPSKSMATAIASVKDNTSYRIVIKTTPLNQGTFYAWYTDTDEDTYEEILTLGDDVNKQSKVETSFIYVVSNSNTQRVINIYSDVTRVTNEATLVYKYQNRFGQWRTYTVSGIELSDEECEGFEGNEGKPYVPAYLDKHTLTKNGSTDKIVWGGTYQEALIKNPGYSWGGTTNKIQSYAPSADVTEAFNQNISWTVESTKLASDKSIVTLIATQDDALYTFTVVNANGDGSVDPYEEKYNELIDVTAATENSRGEKFLCWKDTTHSDNEFIVTYSNELQYRITEDRTVEAVYGENTDEGWTAAIEKVTQTREYQNSGTNQSDYVYVDFLMSFAHPDRIVLKERKGYKFGIIVANNPSQVYNGEGAAEYPVCYDAAVKLAAKRGSGISYRNVNYSCYNLSSYSDSLTIKNRMNYFIQFNNTDDKNRKKTFTAYSYVIDPNGNISISRGTNFNIYEAGSRVVSQ